MEGKLIGLCLCMLMLTTGLAAATTPDTHKGTIQVAIPVGPYSLTDTPTGTDITIQGYGRLLTPGAPNIPAKTFSIALPPGATLDSIQTTTTDTPILGHYTIPPVVLPRPLGTENPLRAAQRQQDYTTAYNAAYLTDNPYPTSIAQVTATGGYRKYNLVDVRIAPITYTPQTGSLVYHQTITLTIDYTIPASFTTSDIITDNMKQTEQTAKDIILNYNQAQAWYPATPQTRGTFDYVIITTDDLTSAVDPLATWEGAKGHSVNVVTTSWIDSNYNGYDLAEKIRNFLRDKYPSEEWGIQFVCLVGGYDNPPMRQTGYESYGDPKTDYYYAELSLPDNQSWDANGNHIYGEESDPIDFETEVSVGRIPWDDPAIVQNISEKCSVYEQNMDDSFKKNILLLGAFFWDDTDNAVLMEAVASQPWMTDWTMTRMYEIPQSSYPCDHNLDYTNVETYWPQGTYAFCDWAGHGSPDAAYELYPEQPFIDETSVPLLSNQYPSIVFADSCSNSDSDYLNIGQAIMRDGGVGFLGSNKVAYGCPGWTGPMSGSSQSLDYFFSTSCTSQNYTLGQAHQYGLRQMYVYNLWGSLRLEQFEWGSIWGDPALSMAPPITSTPPATPVIHGPTYGSRNITYSFTTVTTEPDGEQVSYLFNWKDGTTSGWLGPYDPGVTITTNHTWSQIGLFPVQVRAKDINGAMSHWSDPLNVTIVADTAPKTPVVSGPDHGSPRKDYTFTVKVNDTENDQLTISIDWGDGNMVFWAGPYPSNQEFTINHTWKHMGSFTVKVKARDSSLMQSDWGTISMRMPYEPPFYAFLQRLFDRFPHAFPILRHIYGDS